MGLLLHGRPLSPGCNIAGRRLDSKAAEFDPATFRDRYEEALLAHLKAKQAGAVQRGRTELRGTVCSK
jgi:non-homologous end joining protein Ku